MKKLIVLSTVLLTSIIILVFTYHNSVNTGISALQKADCKDFSVVEDYIKMAVSFVTLLIISLAGNCFYMIRDLNRSNKNLKTLRRCNQPKQQGE